MIPGGQRKTALVLVRADFSFFAGIQNYSLLVIIAVVADFIVGKLLSMFGKMIEPYVDAEEIA